MSSFITSSSSSFNPYAIDADFSTIVSPALQLAPPDGVNTEFALPPLDENRAMEITKVALYALTVIASLALFAGLMILAITAPPAGSLLVLGMIYTVIYVGGPTLAALDAGIFWFIHTSLTPETPPQVTLDNCEETLNQLSEETVIRHHLLDNLLRQCSEEEKVVRYERFTRIHRAWIQVRDLQNQLETTFNLTQEENAPLRAQLIRTTNAYKGKLITALQNLPNRQAELQADLPIVEHKQEVAPESLSVIMEELFNCDVFLTPRAILEDVLAARSIDEVKDVQLSVYDLRDEIIAEMPVFSTVLPRLVLVSLLTSGTSPEACKQILQDQATPIEQLQQLSDLATAIDDDGKKELGRLLLGLEILSPTLKDTLTDQIERLDQLTHSEQLSLLARLSGLGALSYEETQKLLLIMKERADLRQTLQEQGLTEEEIVPHLGELIPELLSKLDEIDMATGDRRVQTIFQGLCQIYSGRDPISKETYLILREAVEPFYKADNFLTIPA